MVLTTMIARVADGLPLAASVQENEQSEKDYMEYQNQAKLLFRKLNNQSPDRCSIETGPYMFHYLIESGVCYLVLCDKAFSKRLAYSYLEDLQSEFNSQHGRKVAVVSRPYIFIEFDTYIQKAKKRVMDSRGRVHLSTINSELQDVQRIMVQNIDDVLQRGAAISVLDNKAANLSVLSQKYKKDAHYLNLRSTYAKIAAGCVVFCVFVLYFFVF